MDHNVINIIDSRIHKMTLYERDIYFQLDNENNTELPDFTYDNMILLSYIIFLYDNEYKWRELRKPKDQHLSHMIDYYNNKLHHVFINKPTETICIISSSITPDILIQLNNEMNINIIGIINKLNQLDDQKHIDQYMIELKKLFDEESRKIIEMPSITIDQIFDSFNL